MPGIIEGYNYDIFISYRQKDNKHDGWVTEFVNQLKGELESTFKEDISIYFDENPHNGLLETHNVDKSLEDKLKCLVFIPIISQTYCDPKRFAWQHEFCAFNKLAKEDGLGRDIKLASGNVASRILPVKIHNLDADDTKLIEHELGEVLRGIEFIYKEAGVNRPLKPDDDVKENLNKTNYRNQINKVANAVKEIISALKKQDQQPGGISQNDSKPLSTPQKSKKIPIIVTSVVALTLIVTGILFIPKLFKSSQELEKSIAVLPFKNDSPDQERMYFINGTMESILDNLCKIKDLRVPGRTSVEQYRDNLKPIPTIAKELDVNYILEGSGHRDGNNVRLFVQLLDGRKDKHLWSKTYDADINEIFSMQSEIAQLVAAEIEAIITPEEIQRIEKVPTTSLTAYDYCLQGQEEVMKIILGREYGNSLDQAAQYFKLAMEYDPGYARAYAGLAMVKYYTNTRLSLTGGRQYSADDLRSRNLDSMNLLAEKALELDDGIADAYYVKGYYEQERGNMAEAMEFMKQAIASDPNNTKAMIGASAILKDMYDYVGSFELLHSAAGLEGGTTLALILNTLAWDYWLMDLKEPCEHYLNEYISVTGDSLVYYTLMFYFEFQSGRAEEGFKYAQAGFALDTTDQDATLIMGRAYLDLEQYEQAYPYYTRYFSRLENSVELDVNDMNRMGYLLWMLGKKEEAQHYFHEMIAHCKRHIRMNTGYGQTAASFDIAGVYAFIGEKDSAYHYLEIFKETNMQIAYLVTMLKELDPLFEPIRHELRFQQLVDQIETKYQAEHERIRKWLEEQGML